MLKTVNMERSKLLTPQSVSCAVKEEAESIACCCSDFDNNPNLCHSHTVTSHKLPCDVPSIIRSKSFCNIDIKEDCTCNDLDTDYKSVHAEESGGSHSFSDLDIGMVQQATRSGQSQSSEILVMVKSEPGLSLDTGESVNHASPTHAGLKRPQCSQQLKQNAGTDSLYVEGSEEQTVSDEKRLSALFLHHLESQTVKQTQECVQDVSEAVLSNTNTLKNTSIKAGNCVPTPRQTSETKVNLKIEEAGIIWDTGMTVTHEGSGAQSELRKPRPHPEMKEHACATSAHTNSPKLADIKTEISHSLVSCSPIRFESQDNCVNTGCVLSYRNSSKNLSREAGDHAPTPKQAMAPAVSARGLATPRKTTVNVEILKSEDDCSVNATNIEAFAAGLQSADLVSAEVLNTECDCSNNAVDSGSSTEANEVNAIKTAIRCPGTCVNMTNSTKLASAEPSAEIVLNTCKQLNRDAAVAQNETLGREAEASVDLDSRLHPQMPGSPGSSSIMEDWQLTQEIGKRKPFVCEICESAFTCSGHLKRHKLVHTGEKPFACGACGSTFTQHVDLKIHLRVHTGERPYLCEVCGAGFMQSSHLASHRRVHTGERPYECRACRASFTKMGDLTRHLMTHRDEKPFTCSECQTSFTRPSSLKRHISRHGKKRKKKSKDG